MKKNTILHWIVLGISSHATQAYAASSFSLPEYKPAAVAPGTVQSASPASARDSDLVAMKKNFEAQREIWSKRYPVLLEITKIIPKYTPYLDSIFLRPATSGQPAPSHEVVMQQILITAVQHIFEDYDKNSAYYFEVREKIAIPYADFGCQAVLAQSLSK